MYSIRILQIALNTRCENYIHLRKRTSISCCPSRGARYCGRRSDTRHFLTPTDVTVTAIKCLLSLQTTNTVEKTTESMPLVI